jgi:hypothetical protein
MRVHPFRANRVGHLSILFPRITSFHLALKAQPLSIAAGQDRPESSSFFIPEIETSQNYAPQGLQIAAIKVAWMTESV